MKRLATLVTAALVTTTLAACGSGGGSDSGDSVTLRLASYALPATNDSQVLEWWAEEVEKRTDGAVKVDLYFSEKLFKAAETLQGLSEGRADIGYSCDVYFPNELPLTNVSGLPFQTSEGDTQARAWNQLYQDYEPYTQEWESNDVAMIGMLPTSPAGYWAKDEVKNIDDLSGAKTRAVGQLGKYVEAIGQAPINLAGPEVYEAFQRGTIDAAFGVSFDFGMSFKHYEVAPYVYESGVGNFASCFIAMNLDTWNELDESAQQVIEDLREPMIERAIEGFTTTWTDYCEELADGGGTAARLPEGVVEDWEEAVDPDARVAAWSEATEGGAEYYAEYSAALEQFSPDSTQKSFVEFC